MSMLCSFFPWVIAISMRFGTSVFIPIPEKGNAKECSNYHIIALISHASKVMLKIFQTRFQQFMNCELPDVQAGFRKGPMDCSLPGSSHGIFWARVLEWVAISFSRWSSWPRDQTQVSHIRGRCFNLWASREAIRLDSLICYLPCSKQFTVKQ